MNKHRSLGLAAGIAVLTSLGGAAAPSRAATVVDYFNDYGINPVNVSGLGAPGDGWAAGWTGTATAAYPQYVPGTSLSFNSPNYSNAANQSGADDGAAQTGTSGNAGLGAYRSLATPMTGTVWISALARFTNAAPDVLLVLDATSGTSNYVSIRGEGVTAQARISTAGVVDQDEFGAAVDDVTYATNSTFLMLSRIQLNSAGTSDQIDYWIFDGNDATTNVPALPASAAELPATPSFSKTGEFFGDTFTAVGVALNKTGSQLDAIRISNEANGFTEVTAAVPEPTALGVAAMVLGSAMMRRRRP